MFGYPVGRAVALLIVALVLLGAAPARGEVRLIDVATGAVTGPVHDGSLLAWTDAGLFVTDGSQVWRVADGTATLQPQYQGAVSIGPGGHAVFGDFGAFELRDGAGKTITRRRVPVRLYGPSVSWGQKRVAVLAGDRLHVLDLATGALEYKRDDVDSLTEQGLTPDDFSVVVDRRPPGDQRAPTGACSTGRRTFRRRGLGVPERLGRDHARHGDPGPRRARHPRRAGPGAAGAVEPGRLDARLWAGRLPGPVHARTGRARRRGAGREAARADPAQRARSRRPPVVARRQARFAVELGDEVPETVERRGTRHPGRSGSPATTTCPALAGTRRCGGWSCAPRGRCAAATGARRRSAACGSTTRRSTTATTRPVTRSSARRSRTELDKWLHAAGWERIEAFDEITC